MKNRLDTGISFCYLEFILKDNKNNSKYNNNDTVLHIISRRLIGVSQGFEICQNAANVRYLTGHII